MKHLPFFILFFILLLGALCFSPRPVIVAESAYAPPLFARVTSAPLSELSGLAHSRRQPKVVWAHNDSGDEARLFALDTQGRSILPTYAALTQYGDAPQMGKTQWQGFAVLGASNVDWEDITADDNYLYVADLGNNRNRRRNLAIYALSEIDPTASTRSAVIQKYPVVYPDQHEFPDPSWDFDSESLFAADGNLYVITKHRAATWPHKWERGAKLYRLDTRYTDRDNLLTLVDSHPELTAATGAELSPDGQRLAVVSYTELWLFERPAEGGDKWLSAPARRIALDPRVLKQVESVTWLDEATLLLGNEQRELYLMDAAAVERAPAR
ncbi:MAG: LpqB family beta-propeller domain-containing protein [Pseudomonadales bacterium]|jgi:hypothetical protein|nr:LpqB family beta-propeller domain-containing protein [Pseudomonadales bacterium]